MSRDPLTVLRNLAAQCAIGARARGDRDEERRWLDVTILLDQHDEAAPERERLATARAVVRVKALADNWEQVAGEESEESAAWRVHGPQSISVPFAVRAIRAALAPETPEEQP